jgi:FtsP/CotA-like multicopper oxidase with cupredoxin domain
MGERYDVLVRMGDSPGRVVAVPLGKKGRAVALLRPHGSTGTAPPAGAPVRTPRRIASYADMKSVAAGPPGKPDVEHQLDLGFNMPYTWTIGGTTAAKGKDIRVERGQNVRFTMRNETMMPHPMHLHGHSFRPVLDGGAGPLKDTILVAPHQEVGIDFLADNPGRWMLHCHNAYHAEAGMMRTVVVA